MFSGSITQTDHCVGDKHHKTKIYPLSKQKRDVYRSTITYHILMLVKVHYTIFCLSLTDITVVMNFEP